MHCKSPRAPEMPVEPGDGGLDGTPVAGDEGDACPLAYSLAETCLDWIGGHVDHTIMQASGRQQPAGRRTVPRPRMLHPVGSAGHEAPDVHHNSPVSPHM